MGSGGARRALHGQLEAGHPAEPGRRAAPVAVVGPRSRVPQRRAAPHGPLGAGRSSLRAGLSAGQRPPALTGLPPARAGSGPPHGGGFCLHLEARK